MSNKAKSRCACGASGVYYIALADRSSREAPGTGQWACREHVNSVKRSLDQAYAGSAYRVVVRLPKAEPGERPTNGKTAVVLRMAAQNRVAS